MVPAFKRAANSVLSRLGQDAVLRGEIITPPLRAHIAEDVEIIDREGNVAVASFVATLMKDTLAAKGDTLLHPDGSFVLEAPIDSNGASVRFTARKVA